MLAYAATDLLSKRKVDAGSVWTPLELLASSTAMAFAAGLVLFVCGLGESGRAPWAILADEPLVFATSLCFVLYWLLGLVSYRYLGLSVDADDIINCGGLKVAPGVVEAVAMRYSEVADCACFGVRDELTGSAVRMSVVPRDASRFDLVAFRRFLQEHLERHCLPTQIACVTDIPKTPNGKTDRKRLA